MNDINMITNMAVTNATQGNFNSHKNKALANVNEKDTAKKDKELRSAAEGFEAIFIQKMWEQMRSSLPENPYLGSKEEKYWQSMYDQELGKEMASGGGIGLADMVVDQMTRDRVTSPSTSGITMASTFGRQRMNVEPAPLFPQNAEQSTQSPQNINTPAQASLESARNSEVGNNIYANQNNMAKNSLPTQNATANNFSSDSLYENYQNAHEATSTVNTAHTGLNQGARQGLGQAVQFTETVSSQQNPMGASNNVPPLQNSPVVKQALAELENMVNPPEPTIVKTTYTTNLPAGARKKAILDKKGQVTADHLAIIQEQQRAMQKNKIINTPHVGENIAHQEYPEELMTANPAYAHQANRNLAGANAAAQNAGMTSNVQNVGVANDLTRNENVLDGIRTRYRSQSHILPNLNIQQFMADNAAQNYPTVDQIRAEVDKLLGKERKPTMTLAQSNQAETIPFNQPIFQIADNTNYSTNNFGDNSTNKVKNSTNEKLIQNINFKQDFENIIEPRVENVPNSLKTQNIVTGPKVENAVPTSNLVPSMGGPNLEQPEQIVGEYVSALSPTMNIQLPLNGRLESGFGWRIDPFTKERAWHNGIDIQAQSGSPIKAAADGVVSFVGHDQELGNIVIIDHNNGLQSVYGHNSELLVQEGEKISAGMNIAKVGMSGRATGPHLHFEIRDKGLSINPEPYFLKPLA